MAPGATHTENNVRERLKRGLHVQTSVNWHVLVVLALAWHRNQEFKAGQDYMKSTHYVSCGLVFTAGPCIVKQVCLVRTFWLPLSMHSSFRLHSVLSSPCSPETGLRLPPFSHGLLSTNPTAYAGSQAPQPAVHVQGQEPLTASMLAAAPPQEQKQMLGERLFPLIQTMHSNLAGKITGMLLEIDNSELLHMLESPESLRSKVDEAVAVLQAHHAKKEAAQKVGTVAAATS